MAYKRYKKQRHKGDKFLRTKEIENPVRCSECHLVILTEENVNWLLVEYLNQSKRQKEANMYVIDGNYDPYIVMRPGLKDVLKHTTQILLWRKNICTDKRDGKRFEESLQRLIGVMDDTLALHPNDELLEQYLQFLAEIE
ncbi:hypothetical protein LCGC14_0195100 [marine sediment metagenome]|uniref:Uncharacterized protein n=1 Tax=marine sediment metagenome TaxID=412755 RepID=A0A0F9V1S9_9ZZZZ